MKWFLLSKELLKIIGIVMMVLSWFFSPSLAVALIGALFLHIAKKVGLPAMGVAISMNLFGRGIALSSDYIMQAAPKLTANAACIPVADVISASIPLVIIIGIVATVSAFYFLRKDIKSWDISNENKIEEILADSVASMLISSKKLRRILALVIEALFALNIFIIYVGKLQGGDATALIGGTAIFILSFLSVIIYKENSLGKVTDNLVSSVVSASTLTVVEAITGLDGSGF